MISQSIVIGPVAGLFTREMYHFIGTCPTWDKRVKIPSGVYEEIGFWQENLPSLNLKHLGELLGPVCASINSDASNFACGAIMKIDDDIYTSHKNFDVSEVEQSSTWRELEAVHYALESFAPRLTGRSVGWETDNQAVPVISEKGSNKPHLQQLAVKIYHTCKENNIQLSMNWVPTTIGRLDNNCGIL